MSGRASIPLPVSQGVWGAMPSLKPPMAQGLHCHRISSFPVVLLDAVWKISQKALTQGLIEDRGHWRGFMQPPSQPHHVRRIAFCVCSLRHHHLPCQTSLVPLPCSRSGGPSALAAPTFHSILKARLVSPASRNYFVSSPLGAFAGASPPTRGPWGFLLSKSSSVSHCYLNKLFASLPLLLLSCPQPP